MRRVPASTAEGGGPKGKPSTCAAPGSAGPKWAGFRVSGFVQDTTLRPEEEALHLRRIWVCTARLLSLRDYVQDTMRWQHPAISLRCSDEAQQLLAVGVCH